MIRRILQVRLRLVDAVAIAAGAMLTLRVLQLVSAPAAPPEPLTRDGLPSFARVLAHARTNYIPPDVATTGAVPPKKDEANAPALPKEAAAAAPPKPVSPSEQAILDRLGERRDALQNRGRDLDLRERLLENVERKLDQRLNELKALEDKTGEAGAKRAEAENGSLRNLVTMYEAMKPKDAARVFDRLALDVLVPVVLQMNPRKMAEVLAAMAPESAERLTVALANRARGVGPEVRAEAGGAAAPAGELPAITDPPARPAR